MTSDLPVECGKLKYPFEDLIKRTVWLILPMWSSHHLLEDKQKVEISFYATGQITGCQGADQRRSPLIEDQCLPFFPSLPLSLSPSKYKWPPAFASTSLHLLYVPVRPSITTSLKNNLSPCLFSARCWFKEQLQSFSSFSFWGKTLRLTLDPLFVAALAVCRVTHI